MPPSSTERRPSFPSGRYEIERRLGEGSVGTVYLAHDRERGRKVALKTLRRVDPLPLFRFKQEFRALAGVDHPNLVRLYEMVHEDGQWFFTMEAIDGVDFLTYGRKHPKRLEDAIAQLVRGIDALHATGSLHRDIKPTNVLVTRDHRVVLLDFGLVTALEVGGFELGDRRRVCGTAGYMSPEQAAAGHLTPASDFYSLGAMLYEALTGDLPFVGEVDEVLLAKRKKDGPAPRLAVPDVDPLLDRLSADLLKRRADERPTAEVILRRLGVSTFEETLPPRPQSYVHSSTPILTGPKPVFVGREMQLARMVDAHDAASRDGRPVAMIVSGESGIGKSALVRSFLSSVNVPVLTGRCYERENVPFKAIDPLIDALCHHLLLEPKAVLERLLPADTAALAHVFPVLCRSEEIDARRRAEQTIDDPSELRRRAFGALRELLERISERQGLVLYVDDVQWADRDSAAVLHAILREPRPPPLFLIVCARSDEAPGPFLTTLRNLEVDVQEIALGPLSTGEAQQLADTLLETHAGPHHSRIMKAKTIAAETAGHPFFVSQLARYAADESVSGGELELDRVLERRIERLSESARRLLEIVAMCGHPLERSVALHAADIADTEREAVSTLLGAHLLRSIGNDDLATAHDRIREHVAARLDESKIARYHRRLAAELERHGRAEPETLAHHYLGYGRPDRAAELFERAGRRAFKKFAFDRAARLFEAAIDANEDGQRTAKLYRRLATALANGGRGAAAAEAYLTAAELADIVESIDCKRRAAEQFLRSGHVDEGQALLEEVLSLVGMPVPRQGSTALASLLGRRLRLAVRGTHFSERRPEQIPKEKLTKIDIVWSGALGLGMVDIVRSFDFQTAHMLAALDAGEPYRVARALAAEALNTATGGGPARKKTRKLLLAAERLAARIDHPHAIGLAAMATGMSENLVGHWSRGVQSLEHAIQLFSERCTGVAWERNTSEHMRLWALAYLGDFSKMRARVFELERNARERTDRYALSLVTTGLPNLAWLAAGDASGANEALAEGIARWSHRGYHLQHYNHLLGETHLYLYRGRAELAHRRLTSQWRQLERSLLLKVQQIRIEALHLAGRVALAGADVAKGTERERRIERAERLAKRIEREEMPWGMPLGVLLLAGAAERRGQTEEAITLYSEASAKLQAVEMNAFAKAARAREGRLLGGALGERRTQDAMAWFTSVGVRAPASFASIFVP